MKRLFTTFWGLFFVLQSAFCQESSLFSHFYLDETFYNPAFTGSMGYPILHLVYRKQWVGLQGTPETMMLYGNMHHKNMGFGARIYQDNTGIFSRTGTRLTYSYLIDFNNKHTNRLAFGMSAGFLFNNLNFERIRDISDPALIGLDNTFGIDGDFGVAYFYKNLEIGFAFPQLFNRSLSNKIVKEGLFRYLNQSITSVGYKFFLADEKLRLMPLFIYKIGTINRGQWDFALSAHWEERFWAAYTYRTEFGNAFSAGFRFQEFSVSYVHEMPNGGLGVLSNGSHELMLSYHFGGSKRKKTTIPEEDNFNEMAVVDTITPEPPVTVLKDSTDIASTDTPDESTDDTDTADATDTKTFKGNPELQSFPNTKVGKIYRLKNVNFAPNKADINSPSYPYLDNLAELMLKNPELKIEVSGHTDNKGTSAANLKLSQDRANVVMAYLVKKGVATDRLTAKGYGDTLPLARHDDEDNAHLNRRIEIKFVE